MYLILEKKRLKKIGIHTYILDIWNLKSKMFTLIILVDEIQDKIKDIINNKIVEIFDGFQNYYDKGNI